MTAGWSMTGASQVHAARIDEAIQRDSRNRTSAALNTSGCSTFERCAASGIMTSSLPSIAAWSSRASAGGVDWSSSLPTIIAGTQTVVAAGDTHDWTPEFGSDGNKLYATVPQRGSTLYEYVRVTSPTPESVLADCDSN